jgi:predicted ATP-dependent serine protease
MLRAAKNRFGSADEVGVYEMSAASHGRLIPVTDPSSLFLATRVDTSDSEGCAISLVLEGIRPMTVEVQALVSQCMGPATFSGRRTVNGISAARLLLLLAVLQKRFGISFHRQDVYVNVAGGIQLGTTQRKGDNTGSGSDLAVAIALVSSLMDIPVRSDTAFVGEVGLLGELRPVPSIDKRVQEARRMGFSRIITPNRYNNNKRRQTNNRSRNNSPRTSSGGGIDWIECDNLLSAINAGLIRPLEQKKRRTSRTKTTNVQGGNQQQGVRITGSTPGSINDLNLDTDDEEDDTITFNDVDELPFE